MMPDREKTRPYLVERVRQTEVQVVAAKQVERALGNHGGSRLVDERMSELALAGTVLALADAEWEREAKR